jgi:translation elongation factor EF-G
LEKNHEKLRYGNPIECDHFDHNLRMICLKAILRGFRQIHVALMEGYYDSSVNIEDSSTHRLLAEIQCEPSGRL